VRENQTLVIEDLAVSNLVGNRRLARAISDLAAGLAVTVCGAGVRPQWSTPGGRSAMKQKPQRRES
jgi:putative transposase